MAESNLGCSVRERITSSLGRQRATGNRESYQERQIRLQDAPRTTQPSVHLDNAILPGRRVKRILDVAFTDDAQVSDNLQGSRAEHMVFVIREGLGRRDDDGVTGVGAEGVEILHVAANDSVLGRA